MSIEVQISWKLLHYGARVQFLGGSCSLNTMRKDSILFFFYADIRMKIKRGSLPSYFFFIKCLGANVSPWILQTRVHCLGKTCIHVLAFIRLHCTCIYGNIYMKKLSWQWKNYWKKCPIIWVLNLFNIRSCTLIILKFFNEALLNSYINFLDRSVHGLWYSGDR